MSSRRRILYRPLSSPPREFLFLLTTIRTLKAVILAVMLPPLPISLSRVVAPSSTRSPRPRRLRPTGRPHRIIDTDPHFGRLQDIIIPDAVKRRLGGLQPQYLLLAAGAVAAVR